MYKISPNLFNIIHYDVIVGNGLFVIETYTDFSVTIIIVVL